LKKKATCDRKKDEEPERKKNRTLKDAEREEEGACKNFESSLGTSEEKSEEKPSGGDSCLSFRRNRVLGK